ncbi:MAG TPA: FAD-dependent thymidylate synthase [Anaerolineae bacterium]|nr:FAD-dependent thymidylate synthase [Anaerolineae bacterium]HOR00854.1 FAD-dependent thymidylate synthase [Anaerolineae bacterium]
MNRRPVLDQGYIELEEWMGGDEAVIRAARICYQSAAKTPGADERLIRKLLQSEPKHNTVFEHAVFRWHIKCPIFVARQWMRHRVGSFNELSLRYCIADRCYYVPAGVSEVAAYRAHMEASFDLYERLVAAGWRKEQARGVLGTAIYTEFIWTINAWSLMNWLTKRLDKAAQWEHRQYALAALSIWREVMPVTANAFAQGMLRPLGLEDT